MEVNPLLYRLPSQLPALRHPLAYQPGAPPGIPPLPQELLRVSLLQQLQVAPLLPLERGRLLDPLHLYQGMLFSSLPSFITVHSGPSARLPQVVHPAQLRLDALPDCLPLELVHQAGPHPDALPGCPRLEPVYLEGPLPAALPDHRPPQQRLQAGYLAPLKLPPPDVALIAGALLDVSPLVVALLEVAPLGVARLEVALLMVAPLVMAHLVVAPLDVDPLGAGLLGAALLGMALLGVAGPLQRGVYLGDWRSW